VRRHRRDRPLDVGAATDLLAIPAVLGRQHLPLRDPVVEAVRPPEIIATLDAEELLGGKLGALRRVEMRGPVLQQLIATMLCRPDRVARGIDGDRDRVADTGGPALAVGLRLTRAIGIEAPDARAGVELATRVLPR
jgi:hypothetical protein